MGIEIFLFDLYFSLLIDFKFLNAGTRWKPFAAEKFRDDLQLS